MCVCVFSNVMTLVATLCRYDRTEVTKRVLAIFRACWISSWSSSNMCLASFCATEDVYRLANLSAFYNLSAFNKLTCSSCLAHRSAGLPADNYCFSLRKSRLHMFESLIILLCLLLIITVKLFLTSCLMSAVILDDICHVFLAKTIRQTLWFCSAELVISCARVCWSSISMDRPCCCCDLLRFHATPEVSHVRAHQQLSVVCTAKERALLYHLDVC